ncbi:MAG: type VI secretion system Vgr family protein [Pseudomonadota bacterium]
MMKTNPIPKNLFQGRQHQRFLRFAFIHGDGPDAQLLINKLDAREALSRDFEYELELLSDDATIPLKALQGKLVRVELVRADGSLRYFTGYIFSSSLKSTDDGVAHYVVQIGPWLRFLRSRKDNYLFHERTTRDITDTVFRDYGVLPVWACTVRHKDPILTQTCQFDESDHNFLHRLWEALGWHYWYEHTAEGHRLMLSDDSTYAAKIDGGGDIVFQQHTGSAEDDGIHVWSPVRTFSASEVALVSFDFKNPGPREAQVPTLNQQGKVPAIETYEYVGAYGFANGADGDRLGRLRMEEIEAAAKHVDARGSSRFVQPGRVFYLCRQARQSARDRAQREYLIVSAVHSAGNNYLQNVDQAAHYTNELVCLRKKIPWRPGRGYHSTATKIYGIQTATVVGPDGENLYVDNFGRVRVQFHWDRVGKNNQASSCWVRISSSWAGAQQGFLPIPRIGQSVTVQFLDGNCDRPIITGSVVNQDNMPAWALPSQLALTGMRSRELTRGGGNSICGRSGHLVFDDTNGQIQTQLKSDHLHSQLSLGYITRIENNAGRTDGRGQGFELRSDGVGVLRAAQGLLISTQPRPRAHGHITDMDETVQRLAQAGSTHDSLAKLAQQHQAQELESDQSVVAQAIKLQHDAIKGGASEEGAFPELSEPHMVLASPSGIETTSAGSTHIASAEHIAMSAGRHLSIAAGKSLFASVAHKFSLFVHQLGIKLIAASGNVQIQAQNDALELLAKKVVEIISTTDWITLRAKKGVRINAGGSELEISAEGIKGRTAGVHHMHAADHQTMGPQSVEATFPGSQMCKGQAASAAQSGSSSVRLT